MKMIDYACRIEDTNNYLYTASRNKNIDLPNGYKNAKDLKELSIEVSNIKKSNICILPFCHTVEAESMGAIINYGDEITGPRCKEYKITDIKDVLNIGDIDFKKGRIFETLKAINLLKEENKIVMLEITGPVTLLNTLLDAKYIYKAIRKDKETMKKVFNKISKELIRYVDEAVINGVDIISYADSAAGLNIVGPKMMQELNEMFTYEFIKELNGIYGNKVLIHLCPKTTYALVGDDRAILKRLEFNEEEMSYGDLLILNKAKGKIFGDRCINQVDRIVKTCKVNEVVLIDK